MLDIKYLRQNAESIKQALLIKGFELDINTFNSLENNRKSLQGRHLQIERNLKRPRHRRQHTENKLRCISSKPPAMV